MITARVMVNSLYTNLDAKQFLMYRQHSRPLQWLEVLQRPSNNSKNSRIDQKSIPVQSVNRKPPNFFCWPNESCISIPLRCDGLLMWRIWFLIQNHHFSDTFKLSSIFVVMILILIYLWILIGSHWDVFDGDGISQ